MYTFTREIDPGEEYDPSGMYDDSLHYESVYPFQGIGIYDARPVGPPEWFTDPYNSALAGLGDASSIVIDNRPKQSWFERNKKTILAAAIAGLVAAAAGALFGLAMGKRRG